MPRINLKSPVFIAVAILAALLGVYYVFTQIWTAKLWFDSVSYTQVFSTMLVAQIVLFLAFSALAAVIVALNIWVAGRALPETSVAGRSQILDGYRDLFEQHKVLATAIPSIVLGVFFGLTAPANTLTFLAWLNRQPFGDADPYFGLDSAFYVFEYPIWRIMLDFTMSAVAISAIAAVVVYAATGNLLIASANKRPSLAIACRSHLCVLAGLVLVIFGIQNLLDRYGFLVSEGSLFTTGVNFTDWNASVGAKLILAIIAFICAALFFANIFLKRWMLPLTSTVLLVVAALILQIAYPALIQAFEVKPNEPDKERPFIEKQIESTRRAYGISGVKITEYAAVTQVSPGQLKDDAEALPGIRLIDPAVVSPTFEQLQQVRGYYSFPTSLDVDRYVIDGKETDAVVAARELRQAGIPDQNWNNIHTVYTHGYGMVAAYGNRRQSAGSPEWIEKDLPSVGVLGEYEGRIYFGEQSNDFAIVGREEGQAPIELDTPGGGEGGGERTNVYQGKGGVPIGDYFTRLLYATYFSDINILLSDRVNSASQLLYDRTPAERVSKVAPWLTLDKNIYPAVVDGRLVWIVDGYTRSDTFPNSQSVSLRDATADSGSSSTGLQLNSQLNYIRNSVKAVVDATDGTVALYAWDASDPIMSAFSAAFPGVLKSKDEISPDMLAHLRYPEDLFKVQREVLGRYHMTDPSVWYQQSDLWQVPADPVAAAKGQEPPYYLSIKWPGDDKPIFSQTAVFVPKLRNNLASYLSVVAEATSPDYGKLRVLRMSDTQQIDGPGQTFNAMTTDQTVAEVLRPYLNQGSAAASYGNLLTLPMGSGLLYVLPVYTQREMSNASYPALTYVVVRFGEHVGIGKTLQEALDKVFAGDAGAETGETPIDPSEPSVDPTQPPGTTPSTGPSPSASVSPGQVPSSPTGNASADVLLQQAQDAFVAADEALRKGDLAEYQKQVEAARVAVDSAMKKLGR
ncbi:MAG: UPF0182 family protein [Propionibacteriaceae bacterium]|nr:UPF0182 family protein [Propionibacteriaceae bacterium]